MLEVLRLLLEAFLICLMMHKQEDSMHCMIISFMKWIAMVMFSQSILLMEVIKKVLFLFSIKMGIAIVLLQKDMVKFKRFFLLMQQNLLLAMESILLCTRME